MVGGRVVSSGCVVRGTTAGWGYAIKISTDRWHVCPEPLGFMQLEAASCYHSSRCGPVLQREGARCLRMDQALCPTARREH